MLRRYQLQSLVRGPRFPWYLVGVIGFFIVVTWFVAGCEKKVTPVVRPTTPSSSTTGADKGTGKIPKPLRDDGTGTPTEVFIKPPPRPGRPQDGAAPGTAGEGEATSSQQQQQSQQEQPSRDPGDDRIDSVQKFNDQPFTKSGSDEDESFPSSSDSSSSASQQTSSASSSSSAKTRRNPWEQFQRGNPTPVMDEETLRRQRTVKEAMQHAWKGYRQYAWGRDELRPQSRQGMDWLGLGATIVDSLDTLWIMGLKSEFQEARDWVANSLDFNKNIEVSFFETTIRVVGGLCSAYDLSGDRMFLDKAKDIADRLSWAFNTSTGIPYASINLVSHSGRSPGWAGGSSILSEVGTLQLEYKHLAHHLDNKWYYDKVERITDHLNNQRKNTRGLYPLYINPHSGAFTSAQTSYGALGDSFYEYLIKQWYFTGRTESKYKRMYEEVVDGALDHLIRTSSPSKLTYIAEWNGNGPVDKMDHLACFVVGMFVMGAPYSHRDPQREMEVAEGIGETCYQMYARQRTGIAPELVYFREGQDFVPGAAHYILRPEAVEALFYLWRATHNPKWRDYGWKIMESLNQHCRVDAGYCGLRDVNAVPAIRDDQMQSFFLAETLKYLYLLFCEDDVINLEEWVFNTEAHPLRRIA